MRFSDIKNKIVNRMGFESLDALRQAGYRVVRERDGDRYFLTRENELQPLLVKLGEIANIKYGVKTGADGWFHVKLLENRGEYALIESGDGSLHEIESRFLVPVIRSIKNCSYYSTNMDKIDCFLIHIDIDSREIQNYKVYSYVEYGQKNIIFF